MKTTPAKGDPYGRRRIERLNEHTLRVQCTLCVHRARTTKKRHGPGALGAVLNELDVSRVGWRDVDYSRPWEEQAATLLPECCRAVIVCTHFDARGFARLKHDMLDNATLAAAGIQPIHAIIGYTTTQRRDVLSCELRMGFWAKRWAASIANSEAPFFARVDAVKAILEDESRISMLETHQLIAPYPEHATVLINFLTSVGRFQNPPPIAGYRRGRDLLEEQTTEEDEIF